MNKHEKAVQQIAYIVNEHQTEEPVEIEIAVQINNDEVGGQVIYPGIQLYIPGMDSPIFISVGELRILADSADNHCSELIEKKQKKTSKLKLNHNYVI